MKKIFFFFVSAVLTIGWTNNISANTIEKNLQNCVLSEKMINTLEKRNESNLILGKQEVFTPCYIDSKAVVDEVVFNGNIIPPNTWECSVKEGNILYKGTLALKSYRYDNSNNRKTTIAIYEGRIAAAF